MLHHLKMWIKNKNCSLSRLILAIINYIRYFNFPVIKPIHATLYKLHNIILAIFEYILRVFYRTPLFKTQLKNNPKNLLVYSKIPLLIGPLDISIGDNCRISGHSTISGRSSSKYKPQLIIGNNVGISWQNELFVGKKIIIGNNVRLAVKVRLVGYPGHPLDATKRAQGLPEEDDQVGTIIIEDDAWIAAGVTIIGNVKIGRGAIVATGSVVTRDIPPWVLAGGIPAKVIKSLKLKPDS
jgi:acetyltransferase-like isoleucine patch superfamily enzyme